MLSHYDKIFKKATYIWDITFPHDWLSNTLDRFHIKCDRESLDHANAHESGSYDVKRCNNPTNKSSRLIDCEVDLSCVGLASSWT